MRLKHSFGPLAAVESRLNFRNNASLQDSNSNEAHFDDSSSIWDTICPPSTDDPFVKGPPGGVAVPARPRLAVLDNDRRRRGPFGKPFGKPLGQPSGRAATDSPGAADRRNGNRTHGAAFAAGQRNPSDVDGEGSASSSASSCSSASSSGCSSALGSPTAPIQGGIVNPNYPGFEHLAAKLLKLAAGSDAEDSDDDDNNNNNHLTADFNRSYDNNNIEDDLSVNRDSADLKHALLYDKPKLAAAMADATLSSAKEELVLSRDFAKQAKASDPVAPLGLSPLGPLGALAGKMHAAGGGGPRHAPIGHSLGAAPRYKKDSNRTIEEVDEEEEKFSKESTEKEQDTCIVPRKKEKMVMNQQVRKARAGQGHPGFAAFVAAHPDRRLPGHAGHIGPGRRDKRSSLEQLGGFDVYNIETAMPRIDLDLIESHLRAAKEEERRRRNDREEIRRRLAMGSEDADFYAGDQRPGKKPSLQARLQSGMNLQICFMNETLSDTESPSSEAEILSSGASAVPVSSKAPKIEASSERLPGLGTSKPARPLSLPLRLDSHQEWREHSSLMTEADFLARQAQLQTEARMALAQAKDMAHMQMEIERQRQNASPITEMVRHTLKKVGVSFPEDRRRLSRQILTEMNVAQLQVIVNDLHTQIEYLNESLVRFLMERDDLHMEQDSMLVDIEDLTRYLGAKEQTNRGGTNQNNNLFKPNGSSGAGRMNHKK